MGHLLGGDDVAEGSGRPGRERHKVCCFFSDSLRTYLIASLTQISALVGDKRGVRELVQGLRISMDVLGRGILENDGINEGLSKPKHSSLRLRDNSHEWENDTDTVSEESEHQIRQRRENTRKRRVVSYGNS